MQEQKLPTYLIQKIKRILQHPTPKLQQQMQQHSIQEYLQLIICSSIQFEIRMCSCSCLRMNIAIKQYLMNTNPNDKQQIFKQLIEVYLYYKDDSNNFHKIQQGLQSILEQLLKVHFNDEEKIAIFQKYIQFVRQSLLIPTVKIITIIIRSMHYLSLNNQIFVGELILLLKQLKLQLQNFNILSIEIQIIKLIKQIIEIIEINDEQEQNIPQQYLKNSSQIPLVLSELLCNKHQQQCSMISNNKLINSLRTEILQLWTSVWIYSSEQNIFLLCLKTIVNGSELQLVDQKQNIIQQCLTIFERSVTNNQYHQLIYLNRNQLMQTLMRIIQVKQSQIQLLQKDSSYFIEISDDFCKKQEANLVKIRAGSLLSMLCLVVDGFLTELTCLCLKLVQLYLTQFQFNDKIHNCNNNHHPEQFSSSSHWIQAETSLLILSSISDQLEKRPQLHLRIKNYLQQISSTLTSTPHTPIILCRFMQIYSFISYPGCLDQFLPYFNISQLYELQLIKCYETILYYYNKKDPTMLVYLQHLSHHLLLEGTQLNAMLQQTIMKNFALLKDVRFKVVEKLVVWLVEQYSKCNVLKVGKISQLLIITLRECKVGSNDTSENQNDSLNNNQAQQLGLSTINSYLLPVYKQLLNYPKHLLESNLIQIAIQHLKISQPLSEATVNQFLQLSFTIVRRNNQNLNNCINILWIILQCTGVAVKLLPELFIWIEHKLFEGYEEDLWQICYLIEMCVLKGGCEVMQFVKWSVLVKLLNQSSNAIKLRAFMLFYAVLELDSSSSNSDRTEQIINLLENQQLPSPIPIYESKPLAIYLFHSISKFKSESFRVYLLKLLLQLLLQMKSYNYHLREFETKLYTSSYSTAVDLNAYEKSKILKHPLRQENNHIYEQFRLFYRQYPYQNDLVYLQQNQQLLVSILNTIQVGQQIRKLHKIKKMQFQ